jgi:hypothetical protein
MREGIASLLDLLGVGLAAAMWRRAAPVSPRWKRITAAMPSSPRAAAGSFRLSWSICISASVLLHRPVLNSSWAQGAVRLSQPDHGADLLIERAADGVSQRN